MDLKSFVAKPRTVVSFFGDSPSLEGISLLEISLERDGPTLRLRFDLHDLSLIVPSAAILKALWLLEPAT
jgi:hypothetical protein